LIGRELEEIMSAVRSGERLIIVYGVRRVGKSSPKSPIKSRVSKLKTLESTKTTKPKHLLITLNTFNKIPISHKHHL